MKHYVLLFYTSRKLGPDEAKKRQIEILDWAKHVAAMGINLDPRALGAIAGNFTKEGDTIVSHEGSNDPRLTNFVFFNAASKEQAVGIARLHPGLRYGTTVEVREWTSPLETAAPR